MKIQVGDGAVSVERVRLNHEGRAVFRWTITTPAGEFTGEDLRSGVGCNMENRDGMESLLGFLMAAAEAYRYSMVTGRESDNADLFPAPVMEWAYQNDSELQYAAIEVEAA